MDGDNTDSLRTPLLTSEDREDHDEEAVVDDTAEQEEQQEAEEDPSESINVAVASNSEASLVYRVFHANMLPDSQLFAEDDYFPRGSLPLKLLKFIGLTVAMIAGVHTFVRTTSPFSLDRDKKLQLWQIAVFEGNYIVSDCIIFFMVGRLWKQRGVDHLTWVLMLLACNVYFECQHFFKWLGHSVTLYEMHCIWPWQLWAFTGTILPLIGAVVFLHIRKAWNERVLVIKMLEMCFFAVLYLGPTITSPYFHFHHWFAGWILGMHCNFDVWWSRAAMAWCWGMYINGIAVYGRDPILTCEYAYFVATDNRCPFVDQGSNLGGLYYGDDSTSSSGSSYSTWLDAISAMARMDPPADWRNCSAHGYHP